MPYHYGFGSQYLLYILGIVLVMFAQSRVTSAYHKYKTIPNKRGISGKDVARYILDHNDLHDVRVEVANGGSLSDHYDPMHRVVRLSNDIYYNTSIASLSVAAHECGHAIQHKVGYGAIALRNKLLPAANIASQMGWAILVLGLFLFSSTPVLLYTGIGCICIVLLFQIVTLPVEFNASSRAMKQIASSGLMLPEEKSLCSSMLRAAAFTYVAAVLSTLMQILRILLMILGRRRDD